jgi:hypothetical protein
MRLDGRRSSHVRIARNFSPASPFTSASARLRALLREELSVEVPFLGAHSIGVGVVAGRSPCYLACLRDKASRRRSSPASRPPPATILCNTNSRAGWICHPSPDPAPRASFFPWIPAAAASSPPAYSPQRASSSVQA